MEIEFAFTLANENVRLQFLAMERSLRATGFDLPIHVFPYNSDTFDLPAGSQWVHTSLHQWLDAEKAHPMCCKYHCLTQGSSFFTDVDIIYLRDPREVLRPLSGFVVADTEWNKPRYTYNAESAALLAKRSSLWLKNIFNGGFFASEAPLYTETALADILKRPDRKDLYIHTDDQIGLNLLVSQADTTPTNLNLPPFPMESTWAGDYREDFESFWKEKDHMPIFIHWAGPILDDERPINQLFYDFLTKEELSEWRKEQAVRLEKLKRTAHWPIGVRIANRLVKTIFPSYYIQPLKYR